MKQWYFAAMLAISAKLVMDYFSRWISDILVFIIPAVVMIVGFLVYFVTKKGKVAEYAAVILIVDLTILVGLGLFVVFSLLGWLQGALATAIVIGGVVFAWYEVVSRSKAPKVVKQ